MKAAWFPKAWADNPYLDRLRSSLEELGVQFDDSSPVTFGRRWLWRNRLGVQLLHLHMIQSFYAYEGSQIRLRWVARFARNLLIARTLGYRTVFTLHDQKPFFDLHPQRLDYLGHWIAANLTDAVIVHYQSGREALARRFGRTRGVFVCHHPSYIGLYRNEIPRGAAKTRLGYAESDRLLVFFGGIRPSKGVDVLIPTFGQLPEDNVRLLVVGRPWHLRQYSDQIEMAASRDPRVRLLPGFVADDDVQLYMNAADAVVLPFSDVLTSGSAMLAMSFARPVIAPARGCLTDEIAPDTGILYDPTNPCGLLQALELALSSDLELMGRNAKDWVARFNFDSLAQETLCAYIGAGSTSAPSLKQG